MFLFPFEHLEIVFVHRKKHDVVVWSPQNQLLEFTYDLNRFTNQKCQQITHFKQLATTTKQQKPAKILLLYDH